MSMPTREIGYRVDERGCHVCTSHALSVLGYPKIRINRKSWTMSRYIYTIHFGEIPNGMLIRHTCDNRACINPNHLIVGTYLDNARDRDERGRQGILLGSNRPSSKLLEKDVIDIYLSRVRVKVLSEKYKITAAAIYHIKVGRNWGHLTRELAVFPVEEKADQPVKEIV